MTFPVISGNTDVGQNECAGGAGAEPCGAGGRGEKIGIISALATDTVDTSSPGPTVIFQDEIDSLSADVAALEAEGVTKIIALNHVGCRRTGHCRCGAGYRCGGGWA